MKNCQNLSTKSYQKEPNNSNLIIKVNDIVKVENRNYMIDSINNNSVTGTDMYRNTKDFFINDIQMIIFDSSKQTNIIDYIQENKQETLKNSLLDITNKLKNPMTNLKHIKHLKSMKRKVLEQLNDLDLEKIDNFIKKDKK